MLRNSDSTDLTIAELDRLRDEAQSAFLDRDVDRYMRLFSPQLTYKSAGGKIISRERLAADVLRQMRVMSSMETSKTRERLEILPEKVIEVVTQSSSMTATAFFFIHHTTQIVRRGRYVWRKTEDGWQIVDVEVLDERSKSHWSIGFLKPRRLF